MKVLLKIELNRAFKNKWMYITLLVCSVIVLYDIFKIVVPTRIAMEVYANTWGYPVPNLYNQWMELNNFSTASKLLHFIFPLIICIPYSMSIYSDVNSRYIYNIIVRTDKKKYFFSKLVTQFIVGFSVVMYTLLISFLITATLLPAGEPFPGLQYVAGANCILGSLFYKLPLLVSVLIMISESVLFSIIGCISFTFAYLLGNGVMVIVSAFTLYFFEEVVMPLVGAKNPMLACSYLIQLTDDSVPVFLMEIATILITIICSYFLRRRKIDEL